MTRDGGWQGLPPSNKGRLLLETTRHTAGTHLSSRVRALNNAHMPVLHIAAGASVALDRVARAPAPLDMIGPLLASCLHCFAPPCVPGCGPCPHLPDIVLGRKPPVTLQPTRAPALVGYQGPAQRSFGIASVRQVVSLLAFYKASHEHVCHGIVPAASARFTERAISLQQALHHHDVRRTAFKLLLDRSKFDH